MIEMHQGDEPDDADEIGDDYDLPVRRSVVARIGALVFDGASLGLASLLIAVASLTLVQDGTELGDTAYLSHGASVSGNLMIYRVSSAFRLAVAVIALLLALFAVGKVFLPSADDLEGDDGGIADPLWVRAVVGAAIIVSLLAIVAAATTFIYAMQAHIGVGNGFGG